MDIQDATDPVDAGSPPPASEPASAPAQPTADLAEKTSKAAPEPSLDDDLRKVFRNANIARADDGKFAPKDGKPAPKLVEEGKEPKPAAEKPVDQKPADKSAAVPAPQSWKAEIKDKWATLPADVQGYIAQRESEAQARLSELGQRAAAFEDLRAVLEPHAGRMRALNMPPTDYVKNLVAADANLARDPVGFIKAIAKSANLDLNMFAADPLAVGDPQAAQWEARFASIQAENEDLRRQLGEVGERVIGRERAEHAAREEQSRALITKFAADKPDWSELSGDIVVNIQALVQAKPTARPEDILQEAYDRARWGNPQVREKLLKAQSEEAERKRLDEAKAAADRAKRAGSINVRSSAPNHGASSLDDDLRAIYRRSQAS